MIKIIPTVLFLVVSFVTPTLFAQEEFVSIHDQKEQEEVSNAHNHEKKRSLVYFMHKRHEAGHHHHKITMSLDEIISSDDMIDFNCTGGFCMKRHHTHKKGLSTRRQLFHYFMRIST